MDQHMFSLVLPKEFGKVGAMDKEGNKGDQI